MRSATIDSKKKSAKYGYQHLSCKNPSCGTLLKVISFLKNWDKEEQTCSKKLKLIHENGFRFYVCPQCHAKNFIVFEGEKIILEKIVAYEPLEPGLHEKTGEKPKKGRRPVPLLPELAFEI